RTTWSRPGVASGRSIFRVRPMDMAGNPRMGVEPAHERRLAMSDSISNLLTRNLREVFGEGDPARRRAAIDDLFTEDCVFCDPRSGVHRGRGEIDRIAGAVRATHPDFQYTPTAEPEELHNAGRVRWGAL